MQEQPKLGKLCDDTSRRDAVHICIAPVVAGETLGPGQHVGLSEDNMATTTADKTIGVVDPFLTQWVVPGQVFWLFLYPGTITGLRHVWTHPAFKPKLLVEPTK